MEYVRYITCAYNGYLTKSGLSTLTLDPNTTEWGVIEDRSRVNLPGYSYVRVPLGLPM